MASGPEHDIKQLNALIEVTLGSAEGYIGAADAAKASRFSAMFRERGTQLQDIATRMGARVKSLGGDPEAGGTTPATARSSFADLKHKMSGSDPSIIAEVEAGESHMADVYQKIVLDEELSDPVRTAIESEFAQIQANNEAMRALKRQAA